MGLSTNKYKNTLDEKEAFLFKSLAEERKAIFTIEDTSRLVGSGAKICDKSDGSLRLS